MNINSINKSTNIYKDNDSKSKKSIDSSSNGVKSNSLDDRVEISTTAKKLSTIQAKIEQGFYETPEVLREVAKKMEKDIF